MTAIAEFTLPAADFPLGRVFDTHPEATLELDRVVPSSDTVMPYFWVHEPAGDLDSVLDVFDGLTELRSAVLMEDLGDRGLFRAEWEPAYIGIMGAVAATGVTVLAASGSSDGWTFEVRADADDQLSQFQAYCTEHEIDVTLTRLHRLTEMTTATGAALTPEQREALELAYEEGYYDEPRGTDQATLAAELGITRQALSARLRRGYRTLIERVLASDAPTA